jgi:hypothetical protein
MAGWSTPDYRCLAPAMTAKPWPSRESPTAGPGTYGRTDPACSPISYLGIAVITGTRKPRGRDLTDVQRACNTAINRLRAAVERSIAHLVNWKVLDTGWRGRLTDFPDVLRTVTGLEIYRTWRWSLSE